MGFGENFGEASTKAFLTSRKFKRVSYSQNVTILTPAAPGPPAAVPSIKAWQRTRGATETITQTEHTFEF